MSLPLSIADYIKKRPKRILQNVQRQTKRNECTAEENFHLKNVIRKIVKLSNTREKARLRILFPEEKS